ncbi:b(0,+)-type amino acid transporter 1-like [Nothoprocta perdicaria]|uniref:b(0,+)-type amino acid transporter 1-like n=1 Tax=Nothoprocta perdicaria TaxID=30464 RepID=UPI000E1BC570|nr:b(0,+)-type amino acid transporter 1-like [Nothoprocta perdicaria]
MRKRKTTDSSTDLSEGRENLRLKQEVGVISGVSFIAGTMVGSGIFMSPEWVLYHMGSPASSLVIWASCGLLAMLGALSYAELGTIIKESGGEYIYILRIFGPLPAFLFAYSSVILVRPGSLAAVCLSFAEYAVAPFYPGCASPQIVIKCTAAACILLLTIINCLNVKLVTSIMNIFTAAKLLALLVIAVGGLVLLAKGHTQNFQNGFQNTTAGIAPIGVAFYQGLWSYDGWNNLNYVTEELKKPEVTLPRAVMIAIPLVTCLYLLVNVSYFAAMTPSELLSSGAVAVTWGDKVLGSWAWLISLFVVLSTFGSSNGTFFSGGRLCYTAAREGHMPDILSMAHVRRLTPSPALMFTSALSLIMILSGSFTTIVNFFSFIAWFFYGMTILGLLYLKIKKPELPRSYKVPIVIPIIVLVAAVYLVLAPIIDQPKFEFLYLILFTLSGIIFYLPLVRFKYHPRFLKRITLHLQLLLEVAPTTRNKN